MWTFNLTCISLTHETHRFGEMNGTHSSSIANTSAYRNVATAVHWRLM